MQAFHFNPWARNHKISNLINNIQKNFSTIKLNGMRSEINGYLMSKSKSKMRLQNILTDLQLVLGLKKEIQRKRVI